MNRKPVPGMEIIFVSINCIHTVRLSAISIAGLLPWFSSKTAVCCPLEYKNSNACCCSIVLMLLMPYKAPCINISDHSSNCIALLTKEHKQELAALCCVSPQPWESCGRGTLFFPRSPFITQWLCGTRAVLFPEPGRHEKWTLAPNIISPLWCCFCHRCAQ